MENEPERLHLPKLGETLQEGREIAMEIVEINSKLTKDKIKTYLRGYGLSLSGNRDALLNRLCKYANERDAWTGLFQPAASRTRGGASGSRALRPSTKRTREKFGNEADTAREYPNKKAAKDLPDTRNKEEVALFVEISDKVIQEHNARIVEKDMREPVVTLPAASGASLFEVRRIERAMNGVKTAIEDHTMALRLLQVQNQAQDTGQQQQRLNTESSADHAQRLPKIAIVPASGNSFQNDNTNLVTVSLDDLKLTFDPQTVKDPPTVSFSHDIDLLIKEWHCSDRLVVASHNIPIRHWNAFYMASAKIKPHAWATFRGTWNNWKFIVTEYESFASPNEFWEVYQKDGKRMNYQAILNALKIRRKVTLKKNEEENAADTADARRYYNGNFTSAPGHIFEYRKSGRWHIYVKNQDIGPRWRKLLEDREDIRKEWMRIKSAV